MAGTTIAEIKKNLTFRQVFPKKYAFLSRASVNLQRDCV